jgi:hypothetical protein
MSDDPQSEIERNRLLEERDRLMKAQQHLERVLGGGGVDNTDQEMDDVGPQEAVGGIADIEMVGRRRTIKTEGTLPPQTPGMSGL